MKNTLILIFSLILNTAFATVRFTAANDLIGDYQYDMDLDGDNDFNIVKISSPDGYQISSSKTTSYFAAPLVATAPKAYPGGSALGNFQWSPANMLGSLVNFNNGTKYLMVKFDNSQGQTFYGWFEIEVNQWNERHVTGYAYEDVPGQTITPGQMTGIVELAGGAVPKTTINNGFLSFSECSSLDRVVVFTVEGKQLASIESPEINCSYPIGQGPGLLILAFYHRGQLLASATVFR